MTTIEGTDGLTALIEEATLAGENGAALAVDYGC